VPDFCAHPLSMFNPHSMGRPVQIEDGQLTFGFGLRFVMQDLSLRISSLSAV
jgi:hypothetical protein